MPHRHPTGDPAEPGSTPAGPGDADRVLETRGLVKRFGDFVALDGLDLEVRRGEVHGFLGPNGAGKSTTIRILLGLVRASAGRARLLGRDPWSDAASVHARLAYVPGDVSLWPGLTGGECLDVLASVHGPIDETRRRRLVDRFDLDTAKRSQDYSKGNRQKVALVAALATRSELLVLDEPTSGLDPLMEQVFQDTIRERREEGCTVLLSSHILGEVEALADRVSIIRRGRNVSTGTLHDLRRHTSTQVRAVTEQRPADLTGAAGVTAVDVEPGDGQFTVSFRVDADHVQQAIGSVHRAGLRSITATPPSLDDLFLQNYGAEDEAAAEVRR